MCTHANRQNTRRGRKREQQQQQRDGSTMTPLSPFGLFSDVLCWRSSNTLYGHRPWCLPVEEGDASGKWRRRRRVDDEEEEEEEGKRDGTRLQYIPLRLDNKGDQPIQLLGTDVISCTTPAAKKEFRDCRSFFFLSSSFPSFYSFFLCVSFHPLFFRGHTRSFASCNPISLSVLFCFFSLVTRSGSVDSSQSIQPY